VKEGIKEMLNFQYVRGMAKPCKAIEKVMKKIHLFFYHVRLIVLF